MKFTIDQRELDAKAEDTIMDASRRAGIVIPGLCYSEAVSGTHCCRLCMVEVEERGRRKLVAACAYKVKEDLPVFTDTDRVKQIRKTMLKLLYSQAPDNPVIIALMDQYGSRPEPKISVKPNQNQCILCGLCAEACKNMGICSISTISRGTEKRIATPYDEPSDGCIGCASCAQICPTNCIEVEDRQSGRTIWNKTFEWIRCEQCGAIITTREHYLAANEEDIPVLCPTCRRKAAANVFADTLGEEQD